MSHEFNGDGKIEDFIRLVANDNSLISCFLVDPLNDYGAEYRINIYILTTAFGFIFFAVSAKLAVSSGGETAEIFIYLVNFVIFPPKFAKIKPIFGKITSTSSILTEFRVHTTLQEPV